MTDDLQGLRNLSLREKQDEIHKYLKQQREDLLISNKLQSKELKQLKKQELQSILKAMSSGQSKHKSTFKSAAKTQDYFAKPGLLPTAGQIRERDQKEQPIVKKQDQDEVRHFRSRSALTDQLKFSTKVKSVRFIEEIIRIDSEMDLQLAPTELKAVSKPASAQIEQLPILKPIAHSAWLPTSSISRIFNSDKLQSVQDISHDLPTKSPVRCNDWLPTKTRPTSSYLGMIQHQMPTQTDNVYSALKNQLLYDQPAHRRVQSSMENQTRQYVKLEPFKPGSMVAQVFGDPKVLKLNRVKPIRPPSALQKS